jgi:hypothetical protein
MQGFKKSVAVNTKQILFCTDPQVSVGIIVDDTGVNAGDDGRKIVKAGTPMYGSLLDRATPFTITGSDTDPTATATTVGTGITAATVTAATFATAVNNIGGTYPFAYDGTKWLIFIGGSEEAVDLTDYGIEVTGTAATDDMIVVTFTAGVDGKAVGVLLHDVDVTDGDDNGTLLIFGFVNINRLDADVQTAITTAASDLEGKVYICAG